MPIVLKFIVFENLIRVIFGINTAQLLNLLYKMNSSDEFSHSRLL